LGLDLAENLQKIIIPVPIMIAGDWYMQIRYFMFLQLAMSVDIVSEIR